MSAHGDEEDLVWWRCVFGVSRYDVSSAEVTVVPARGKACVSTGLKISIPSGTYARIAPRSGLAVKYVRL